MLASFPFRMKSLAALSAVLILSVGAYVPGAPGAMPIDPNDRTPISVYPADRNSEEQLFINQAGQFILLEQQMGELALQKSSNLSVQNYARKVMADHSRLQQELATLARDLHMIAPRAPILPSSDMQRLTGLQGADFDRDYMSVSVSSHEAAIASFQNEALAKQPRGISLQPLADWAKRTTPILNDELTIAQTTSEAVGGIRHHGGQEISSNP